jgi:hypothetical protein
MHDSWVHSHSKGANANCSMAGPLRRVGKVLSCGIGREVYYRSILQMRYSRFQAAILYQKAVSHRGNCYIVSPAWFPSSSSMCRIAVQGTPSTTGPSPVTNWRSADFDFSSTFTTTSTPLWPTTVTRSCFLGIRSAIRQVYTGSRDPTHSPALRMSGRFPDPTDSKPANVWVPVLLYLIREGRAPDSDLPSALPFR